MFASKKHRKIPSQNPSQKQNRRNMKIALLIKQKLSKKTQQLLINGGKIFQIISIVVSQYASALWLFEI